MPLTDASQAAVRAGAVRILGAYADRKLAPRFGELLKDAEPDVRAFAAEALMRSKGDPFLIPLLAALLEDRNLNVRVNAATALWMLTGSPWPEQRGSVFCAGTDGIYRCTRADENFMTSARRWWLQHKDDPAYALKGN